VDIRETALLVLLSSSACVSPANLQPARPPASFPAGEAQEKTHAQFSTHGLPGPFYTTIAEVLKKPTFFDGQQIQLRGRVVEVRDSSFKLTDGTGNTLRVVTAQPATVREGSEVTVTGQLTTPRLTDSSPPSFVELRDAHIVLIPSMGKTPAKPAATLPSQRSRPSPPLMSPVPPVPEEKDEGRIF
jgi:hypothetical protein